MTTPFLARRDRDALRRQYRRGETPARVVQAERDGRVGLLAVTDRRVLWVSRGALRTRVDAVARDQVAHVKRRTERFGSIVVKTRAGRRFEWWFLERGACDAVLEALGHGPAVRFRSRAPPTPPTAPARSTTRPPPAAPTPPAPVPAASRPAPARTPTTATGSYLPADTAERRARLRRQLEMGSITKREYEWQVESLR